MEHTKEPWPVFTDIAVMMTPDPEGTPAALLSWDDYIRARACVNACAGLETKYLEEYGLPGYAQTISDLGEQRDELLAALELIYSWASNWDSEFMFDPDWKDRDSVTIQDAIANAKGA